MPRRCPHGEISALGSTAQDARVTFITVLSNASTLGAAKFVQCIPYEKNFENTGTYDCLVK